MPRVALVTGASRRVGRHIALRLARDGFDVAVHYRESGDDARETAREILALGRRAITVQGDQAKRTDVEAFVRQTERELGPVELLVNNASIFYRTPFPGIAEEEWDRFQDVNLKGPFFCAEAVAPGMLDRKRGVIVNVVDDPMPRPGYLAYGVSKAGLVAFTIGLARELAPHVRVNAVSPGAVLLPENATEALRDELCREIPLGRIGQPHDVAAAVSFLATGSDYVTGHVLVVDGGRFLGQTGSDRLDKSLRTGL